VGGIPMALLTGPPTAAGRLTGLLYALTAAYSLLSLSYESLVLSVIAALLTDWLRSEEKLAKSRPSIDKGRFGANFLFWHSKRTWPLIVLDHFTAGLWIRIESIRIWIQHFSSIRIRIHNIFESGSNADPDPQRKI
jgi:hypothetical protein